MPKLPDFELVGYYGRYLIYAQEPLSFPLGSIKGLSFPFDAANIMRGCIPVVAIPLKFLSKIFPPLGQFYYFVLVDLLCVFFSALFAWSLVREFNVKSFWTKLLAASLSGLSVILMHKCSHYYDVSYLMMHPPFYLSCVYFYVRLFKHREWKSGLLLSGTFICAALTDYYIFLGLTMGLTICVATNVVEILLRREKRKLIFVKTTPVIAAVLVGVVLGVLINGAIGYQRNFDKVNKEVLLNGRYNTCWGYGGGFGGGFHVADVLSVIIPPAGEEIVPIYKGLGPRAYLASLGFPLTTAKLQDGQYEGFSYIGTIPLGILVTVLILKVFALLRKPKMLLARLRLHAVARIYSTRDNDILIRAIGVSVIALYIMSWGYIIHIGGHRLNNVITPSFILACLYPQFALARSLGRFAWPLSIFMVLTAALLFERYISAYFYEKGRGGIIALGFLVVILIVMHITEVSGYLRQSQVIRGNEIANVFSDGDVATIKETVRGKIAIMVVPSFVGDMNWTMISYSLAFHGRIPISGSTIGPPGESAKELDQYVRDIKDISTGKLQDIVKRYGKICIACPSVLAQKILANSDLPLQEHHLVSRDCVILTLD